MQMYVRGGSAYIPRIYVYETLCPNRCEPSIEFIVKMGVRPGEGGWLVARLGVGGGVG